MTQVSSLVSADVQDNDIEYGAGTVSVVRDARYFQQLHPSDVPAEL